MAQLSALSLASGWSPIGGATANVNPTVLAAEQGIQRGDVDLRDASGLRVRIAGGRLTGGTNGAFNINLYNNAGGNGGLVLSFSPTVPRVNFEQYDDTWGAAGDGVRDYPGDAVEFGFGYDDATGVLSLRTADEPGGPMAEFGTVTLAAAVRTALNIAGGSVVMQLVRTAIAPGEAWTLEDMNGPDVVPPAVSLNPWSPASQDEGDSGSTAYTTRAVIAEPATEQIEGTLTLSGHGAEPRPAAGFVGGAYPVIDWVIEVGNTQSDPMVVNVLGNTTVEPDQQFKGTLAVVSGNATVGTAERVATVVNDDEEEPDPDPDPEPDPGTGSEARFLITSPRNEPLAGLTLPIESTDPGLLAVPASAVVGADGVLAVALARGPDAGKQADGGVAKVRVVLGTAQIILEAEVTVPPA